MDKLKTFFDINQGVNAESTSPEDGVPRSDGDDEQTRECTSVRWIERVGIVINRTIVASVTILTDTPKGGAEFETAQNALLGATPA